MAGMADAQPKAIQAISLPIRPATGDPGPHNSQPAPEVATALSQMNAATQSVKDSEVRAAGRQVALQQAAETLDPAAIQARQAQVALSNIQSQKAQQTINSRSEERRVGKESR